MAKKPSPRPNENGNHHKRGGSVPMVTSNDFVLICERYAETGLAMASCEDLGFNYNTVLSAVKGMSQKGDDTWQDLWDESYQKFRESLERAIITRGRDGTPVKWKVNPNTGERTAIEWQFSDRLLELAAKGHFPERYRTNISVAGTLGVEPVDAFANLTTRAKREIRAIIMRDLEEQRLAASTSGVVIEGHSQEALEDLRNSEDEDDVE